MKVLLCALTVVAYVSAGIVNTLPGGGYNEIKLLNSGLGPDCHTGYGHGHGGQYVQVLPEGRYNSLGAHGGISTYNTGVQQVFQEQAQYASLPAQAQYTSLPAQAQYTSLPVQAQYTSLPAQAQYTSLPVAATHSAQAPLTYTSAGGYGGFQILQTEPQLNTLSAAGVRTIRILQEPVVAAEPAPVYQTLKFIQEPSVVAPGPQHKTLKIVQTPAFDNYQTIRIIKEDAPFNEIRTIRIVHEKIPTQHDKHTKSVRVIEEPSHPDPSPFPTPSLPTPAHPPQGQPPRPSGPLPDITGSSGPDFPQGPTGYQYNGPRKTHRYRV